ncbi:MAG TPA: hypothetical protein VKD26_06240 [Streptosporangiaceae bacterium]|nr:hypothetical protein [Streptosporangiaceae bacterium]
MRLLSAELRLGAGCTSHLRGATDLLNFGATGWVGGNSPLDVEGFRAGGSPVMTAYRRGK